MLEVVKLDSFKTQTELKHFYKHPDFFDDDWHKVNYETGETEKISSNVFFYSSTDSFIQFKAEKKHSFGKIFLEITWTSKMLKERYLEGLDSSNFDIAFYYVMDILNFRIDFDSFINNSSIFDIDICLDYNIKNIEFDLLLRKLKKVANFDLALYSIENPTKVSNSSSSNLFIGCQQSKRTLNYGRIKDAPFFKFYSKYHEMKNNKFRFIGSDNLVNLRRFEFTIKNKNALTSYFRQTGHITLFNKINSKNQLFSFLLSIEHDKYKVLNDIQHLILKKSFTAEINLKNISKTLNDDSKKVFESELEKLTPSKLVILHLLCQSDNYGEDLKDYGIDIKFLQQFGISDSSISRLKSDIKKHYPIYKQYKTVL